LLNQAGDEKLFDTYARIWAQNDPLVENLKSSKSLVHTLGSTNPRNLSGGKGSGHATGKMGVNSPEFQINEKTTRDELKSSIVSMASTNIS